MRGLFSIGCKAVVMSCMVACLSSMAVPASAMDPDRCSAADLERMGDAAVDDLNNQIKNIESDIAWFKQQIDHSRRELELAERELDALLKQLKSIHGTLPPHRRDLPYVKQIEDEIARKRDRIPRLRDELWEMNRQLGLRQQMLQQLRERLAEMINAFRDLIHNPANHPRRTLYETACKVKNAYDSNDITDAMRPIHESPPSWWRRVLPDSSRGTRYDQSENFEARARGRFGGCLNAIAALGGAIISFWPSDSAQAGDFNDAPVNYPIRRGPYMPGGGGGGAGSPICPPEEPAACPPSPYTCPPEEPTATPTPAATPTKGASSSSSSSRGFQQMAE